MSDLELADDEISEVDEPESINRRIAGKGVPEADSSSIKTSPEASIKPEKKSLHSSFLNATNLVQLGVFTKPERNDIVRTGDECYEYVDPPSPRSDGSATPSSSSSQGSLSSMEYIHRKANKIEAKLEEKQALGLDLNLVLSKEESKLLAKFCKDEGFATRLRQFLYLDFASFGLAQHLENTGVFEGLLHRLKNEDRTVLLARFGNMFLEDLRRNKTKLNENRVANMKSGIGTSLQTLDNETIPLILEDERMDTQTVREKKEPGNNDNMDCGEEELPTVSSFSSLYLPNPNKRNKRPFPLSDSGLRRAYDHIKREDDWKKQIDKAGQVLFDDGFSDEEKLNCTLSGKKAQRPFDEDKLRDIKGALKWLMIIKSKGEFCDPNVVGLQADMARLELRLDKDTEEQWFNKAVLTEHAYRCRKKLKTPSK